MLQEYIDLGHMKPIIYNPNTSSNPHYYLPHHAVVNHDHVTPKVRVVFNASSRTSNGNSLTDTLHIGLTLHQNLVVSILRWRFYKVVFNADITKIYRQIQLNHITKFCSAKAPTNPFTIISCIQSHLALVVPPIWLS